MLLSITSRADIYHAQLDPLREDPNQLKTNHSLIPIVRRHSDPETHLPPPENAIVRSRDSSRERDGASPDVHAELAMDPDTTPTREKILGLPAPEIDSTGWNGLRREPKTSVLSDVLWIRAIKSCILVAKVPVIAISRSELTERSLGLQVFDALNICPGNQLRHVILFSVISVGIIDTLFGGIWISFVLGVFHFGIVRLGCLNGRCCV